MTRREAIATSTAAVSSAAAAPELCELTAVELARRLRKKEVSSQEVLEAHLKRIVQVNTRVNAIVTLTAEQALVKAKHADEEAAKGRFLGPLHGLPMAHKDLEDTKGIRTTYGSPIYKDFVPPQNTVMVERMQRAGGITVGKTNTPEFGAGSQTFNAVFGSTKNPYDLTKTCGGSSGGAAAALAARMVPIADGSDMGGSLRNPASFCSVVGFRTSPGRVPVGNSWNPLSVKGPMGRTVEDTALLLSVIAGPDAGSPLSLDEPGSRFAKVTPRLFSGVKMAWCPRFAGLPFDRRVIEVIESRRKVFQGMKAVVEDTQVDFTGADEAFKTLRALSFYQRHWPKVEQHRALVKATVIAEVEAGARLTGPQVAQAEEKRSQLYTRFSQLMEKYEFLLLPVTQVPAFAVDQPYVLEIEGMKMGSYIDWMRSCYFITLTGHPAISVPAGFTKEGLPVGLQIVGRRHADMAVLELALAFERAVGAMKAPVL